MHPPVQQCSLASANQTNPKVSSVWTHHAPGTLAKAHLGALYIELEGQRVKMCKSHFLIVLRI